MEPSKTLGEMEYEEAIQAVSKHIDWLETDEERLAAINAFIFTLFQL